MNFTPEQMNKARSAKSAEELLEMAKESGIELTADEAAKYFADLHKEGELNDDELGTVAGGSKGKTAHEEHLEFSFCNQNNYNCPVCGVMLDFISSEQIGMDRCDVKDVWYCPEGEVYFNVTYPTTTHGMNFTLNTDMSN